MDETLVAAIVVKDIGDRHIIFNYSYEWLNIVSRPWLLASQFIDLYI